MTPITSLLEQLGWPSQALDKRGTLLWTASSGGMEDLRETTASILVSNDAIRVRVRSATLAQQGALEPHLDVAWQLAGQGAILERFVQLGEPQRLEQDLAIGAIQDAINALGVRPQFQALAVRKTAAAPGAARMSA